MSTATVPGTAGDPSDSRAVIELSGYGFQYRAQSAPTLHDVDLVIRRGEKVAIIGASGSGKSTLLSAMNGLIPHRHRGAATGTIRVAGQDPATVPLVETARRVGTVLQDTSGQFVGLTVAEDIAFSLENQQVPRAEMPQRVRRAAEAVQISDHLDASPQDLSGGQKQRAAIAGVLVDDVDVLLFDEPLAMLDPATGREAIELIDRLHRENGTTIVLVEHRLEDVLHRAVDRIVLMADGRIIADAPPDEVLASGLLERHGIRPPLHVAALEYAGAPVTAQQRPSSITDMALTDEQVTAVRAWVGEGLGPTSTGPTGTGPSGTGPASTGPIGVGPSSTGPSDADPSGASSAGPDHPPPADGPAVVLDLDGVGCLLPRSGDTPALRVLDEIRARARRGETLGVLGSNGAGKSSLARVICGFAPTSDGTIRIGGQDAAGWPLARRGEHVGYVLQEPGQMLSRPLITEEIALGLRARGLAEEEIARRTDHVLTVCGLRPFRSWPVSALSHGQKKRLTIACVLALEPEVLILDEPTAGQDFGNYSRFMDFLVAVNAEGTTIVLITHDMHLALEYTDRVLVLSEGRVLADAHPADVLTDQAVTARADLVTTGLYTLAQRCGIADPSALVRRFVTVDRSARARTTDREVGR